MSSSNKLRDSSGAPLLSSDYGYQAVEDSITVNLYKDEKHDKKGKKKKKHIASDGDKKMSLEDELVDIKRMQGFKSAPLKTFLYWLFVICTAGLGMLVAYWFEKKFVALRYRKCTLAEAERVLVVGTDEHFEIAEVEQITKIPKSAGADKSAQKENLNDSDYFAHHANKKLKDVPLEERMFIYKHLRFAYDVNTSTFKLIKPIHALRDILKTEGKLTNGLNSQTYHKFSRMYGRNLIDIPIKSIPALLIQEVLHPFFIFQIYSCTLWLTEDYFYYAGAIFFIASVTAIISLKDVRANLVSIRRISMMEVEVTVVRDGHAKVISSVDLQPGDIVQVPSQFILPCDLLLVNGQAVVNESMLTGESVPVIKSPLIEFTREMAEGEGFSKVDPRHTLFGGTKVVELRVPQNQQALGCVMSTGYQTSKGYLVLSIMFPRPTNFKFMSESIKFMFALFSFALVGFSICVWRLSKAGAEPGFIVQRGFDLITIVVPPALPMAMSVGTAYAILRLKAKKIFCISPPRVNMAGKINFMCFDKTGTLTEEGLDLMGVRPAYNGGFSEMVNHPSNPGPLAMIMMSCHSLTHIDNEIMGDPLETKIFHATKASLEEPHVTANFNNTYKAIARSPTLGAYGVLHQYEFMPALQRMSVVAQNLDDKQLFVGVKGSPEALLELSDPSTIPADYAAILATYTHEGYRVLACGYRVWDKWGSADPHKQRAEAEHSLTFLGFIVMQNKLKPQTTGVIQVLSKAKIRSLMVTGDNPLTAVCIAKECGMVPAGTHMFLADLVRDGRGDHEIKWTESSGMHVELDPISLMPTINKGIAQYGLAMTGRVFQFLQDDHKKDMPKYPFEKIIMGGIVFARMSPEQKAQLVEILQSLGLNVGMCGDGANDCIALRAAHVGVSLSEAEASVSAPFTSSTPSIECIPVLLREGRSSLATSFQLFRFMALYSMTQFTTAILVTFNESFLGNWEYLYEDLWIVFPLVILLGRSRSAKKLSKKRPSGKLFSVFNLSSTMTHILLTVAFQVGVYILLQRKAWYYPIDNKNNDSYGSNSAIFETSSLFVYANFQYLTSAFIFSLGKQWKQAIYTNYVFCIWWAICLLTSFFLLFSYDNVFFPFLQVLWTPKAWRLEMLYWALFNCAMNLIAEFGLSGAKACGLFTRNRGDRRKDHKIYREAFTNLWQKPEGKVSAHRSINA
jgi:cation-transporting ATPase 13A3/4/5